MSEEEIITEFIQDATGFRIVEGDLTTGKVVVNNIEITSIEDWNKVTHSIVELQQENSQLKEEIKELEFIVGLRQKRNLIKKFDKEYDFEDKQKKPNRDYVCITPDAEEVYKRYYDYKEKIEKAIEYIEHEWFKRNQLGICDKSFQEWEMKKLLEILKRGTTYE